MAPTYWDYLRIDQLLALQGGLDDDEGRLMPDELWFKLSLRELRLARDHLAAPKVPEAKIPYVVHHLRRVTAIFDLAVQHFEVMETLTPQDFLAFRDKLIPASGFQSFQLREIEILLGLEDTQRVEFAGMSPVVHIQRMAGDSPAGKLAWQRIEDARAEGTLKAALEEWLYRTPVQGSGPDDDGDTQAVERFLGGYLTALEALGRAKAAQLTSALSTPSEEIARNVGAGVDSARRFLLALDVDEADRARVRRVRAGVLFIESYRELPLLAWPRLLVDTVVELEEQLVLFRVRHARMVERIIGRRIGTGGSSGVDYLDKTASYRIFRDLWEVRTILLPASVLPELERPGFYGFRRSP